MYEATPQMRAVIQDRYGSTADLRLGELARPECGRGEVLIEVRAAAIDRGTWHVVTGVPVLMRIAGVGLRRPKNRVPGLDVAGVVAATGAGVTKFAVGDEVHGASRGSCAGYAVALERKLARKPPTLSFEEAATVAISGITALQAVRNTGRLQPGQRVLITGASGGVGSYAVQIAKAMGATVTAVCSGAKAAFVLSLGADEVIDYTREDFPDRGERYDIIIDIAGNPSLRQLKRCLVPSGMAVIVGGETSGRITGGFGRGLRGMVFGPLMGTRFKILVSKESGDDLAALHELIEEGKVRAPVNAIFALDEVPAAIDKLASGEVKGKVAITLL